MLLLINKNEGQTIIEALIALTVILLTLTAISVAIITSLNNSQFIKNQTLAAKYAQQGIEYIKNSEKNNTLSVTSSAIYCMGVDNSLSTQGGAGGPGACAVNIVGAYKREAAFSFLDNLYCGGGTRVIVNVYWSDTKCPSANTYCHTSALTSCFANHAQGSL